MIKYVLALFPILFTTAAFAQTSSPSYGNGTTTSNSVANALGYTPAQLDGTSKVPIAQLPTIPASQTSGLLPLTGGTLTGTINGTAGGFSGSVTSGPSTAQSFLNGSTIEANGAAGTNLLLRFNTSGVNNWAWVVNGTQSGSNTGANMSLNSYSDTGTILSTPISITRATGEVVISGLPNIASPGSMQVLSVGALTGSGSSFNTESVSTASDNASMSNGISDFTVTHTMGGSAFSGNRNAINVFQNISVALATGVSPFIIGYNMTQTDAYSMGGTSGSPSGTLMGYNGVTTLASGATNLYQVAGAAFDMALQSGSSTSQKIGVAIDLIQGDAVEGSAVDTALTFTALPGGVVSPGWKNLISVGNINGWWPVASTGTIIGTTSSYAGGPAYTAAYGMDFSAVTFSSGFLKSSGFLVDGSGNLTAASYNVGAVVGVTCSGTPTASYASTNGIVTHC